MNRLPNDRRAGLLKLLTEGVGINAAARISGAAKTTVLRLLAEAGHFSAVYQDHRLRGLRSAAPASRPTRSGPSSGPNGRTHASRGRATSGRSRPSTRTPS